MKTRKKIFWSIRYILLLAIFTNYEDLFSQTDLWDINNIVIRNSFLTDKGKLAPAQFEFIKPTGAENSYSIDAGVGYNIKFVDSSIFTLTPNFEHHRNTLIKKKQDFIKMGANLRLETNSDVHPILLTNF